MGPSCSLLGIVPYRVPNAEPMSINHLGDLD